jgi:hypothetical protein
MTISFGGSSATVPIFACVSFVVSAGGHCAIVLPPNDRSRLPLLAFAIASARTPAFVTNSKWEKSRFKQWIQMPVYFVSGSARSSNWCTYFTGMA